MEHSITQNLMKIIGGGPYRIETSQWFALQISGLVSIRQGPSHERIQG